MKRARFTEEQIIAVLKEHEAGAKTADLARKHGVSEATLCNWKAKYGGMDVSEAKRPKALEEENAKLKKRPAEQVPDAAAHRGLLSKKMEGPYPSGVGRRRSLASTTEQSGVFFVHPD
jgi:putative transposase